MGEYALTTGSPVVVPLAALGKINAVFIHASDGSGVTATLASTLGTAVLPVDPVLFSMAQGVPYSALTIAGTTGATVTIVLAEMA